MGFGLKPVQDWLFRVSQHRRVVSKYRRKLGRVPDLEQPTRFTEKIQVSKLRWRSPRMVMLSDKVLVKDYVARLLGPEWITPTLYSGPRLPSREFRSWPKPYVIKVNHRSGGNLFIRSEADEDWDKIKRQLDKWLSEPHGVSLGEWVYTQIRPQVLVEPFIGALEFPVDFKLLCFDGRVELFQIHSGRFREHRTALYDRAWQLQQIKTKHPINYDPEPRPDCFDEMIRGAELLAAGFPFARVDFYIVDGRPRFGEVTFHPDSGFLRIEPDDVDLQWGALWPDYIPD